MSARAFALCFVAILAALLAGTMTANVAIDPEAVFGTHPGAPRVNANSRYTRFVAYRDGNARPDGVLFASSRGTGFDPAALARALGVNGVANFSVNYGMVTDHLPVLEYLIREKAARGERLKSVLLLIDVDHFGKAPWTNINLDGFLPPEVSGEHPARFWWRYLTAFQLRVWRATVAREAGRRAEAVPIARAAMMPPLTLPEWPVLRSAAVRPQRAYDIVQRPQLDAHLALLARMAALCRQHGVTLTVVTSPLNRLNARDYDPAELARVTERIARVVPLWDFGAPDWLSDRPGLWTDPSHFTPEVGDMMLGRVFGVGTAPAGFGALRGG
jgi:hypothetical protein